MGNPRFLLSDIAGVLIHHHEYRCADAVAARFGKSRQASAEIIYFSEQLRRFEKGEMTLHDFVNYCMVRLSMHGSCPSDWSHKEFADHWVSELREPVLPVIALWKLLRRHMRIASASSVDELRLARRVKALPDVYGLFHHHTHSCKIRARKGDLGYFRVLLGKLGAFPEECIFVDDKIIYVEDALRAGIRAIHFPHAAKPNAGELLHAALIAAGVPEHWFEEETVGAES